MTFLGRKAVMLRVGLNCNMKKNSKRENKSTHQGTISFVMYIPFLLPHALIPSTFPAIIIKCLVSDLTFLGD